MRLLSAAVTLAGVLNIAWGSEVRPTCPAADSPEYFAPAEALPADQPVDLRPVMQEEYENQAAQLHAIGEKSLSCDNVTANLTLRFSLWRRNMPRPFIVTLIQADNKVEILGRMRTGRGGGLIEASRTLNAGEWQRLGKRLPDFWKQTSSTRTPEATRDAAIWVMEGRTRNEYHRVEQWAPQSGASLEMGKQLAAYLGWAKYTDKIEEK